MKAPLVGNVHLVEGSAEAIPFVLLRLAEAGISTEANPDLYVRAYASFGIDEARELRERASLGALGEGRRAFVVAAPSMTSDAQNALLKTLEEPRADALFVFIVPAPHTLLSTFRSRAQTLSIRYERASSAVDAKEFLVAAPAQRLELLKPLLEKGDDDKRDLGAILAFLADLERSLEKRPEDLAAIYRARKYITDRGALVKPLLEQVALLVPAA